jgi:hypothetical protein
MRLLVCIIDKLQNARCNDKDILTLRPAAVTM